MSQEQDHVIGWLTLYLTPGLGNSAIKRLVERFGDVQNILKTDERVLMGVQGISRDLARKISKRAYEAKGLEEMEKMENAGARLLTYTDPDFPPLLREISSPPVCLYRKGRAFPEEQLFVGVVGSRNPTHYGLRVAREMGMGLARRGAGVASGLARGIDAAAHTGCLDGGGFTIGVLGTGIDVVYPASNQGLYERVMNQGVVLSEFPMGSPPEPRNFPIRNRIISGLSRGVAVVEATMKSGSLITASFALDQGREVFAVPGSIGSFKSTGTHALIKQGAKLVENADDILGELGLSGSGTRLHGGKQARTPLPDMDEMEKKIYEMIGDVPAHMDYIVRTGKLDPGEASGVLLKMELKGLVKQLPGKMFVR